MMMLNALAASENVITPVKGVAAKAAKTTAKTTEKAVKATVKSVGETVFKAVSAVIEKLGATCAAGGPFVFIIIAVAVYIGVIMYSDRKYRR